MSATTVSATVNAGTAATAWLNAFLATGADENRPLLNRTMSVEFFRGGVQFIATDGTILLRTWVPSVEGDNENKVWPDIAEDPDARVVVMDPDKFALAFIRALLAASKDSEYAPLTMTVEAAPSKEPALGEEFSKEMLTLSAFGQQMHCRLCDGVYPNWRKLQFGLDRAERVDGMTISPRLFAIVGKLREVNRVDCEFSGSDRQIAITATGSIVVRGLLMPMRRGHEKRDESED
jgi:hypothetical protein